jgi:hypothetical protein
VGLYGRPGVGMLPIDRGASVSRRPTAGDHEGPPRIHPAALAPTDGDEMFVRLMRVGADKSGPYGGGIASLAW